MAKTRTFVNPRNWHTYTYERDHDRVRIVGPEGEEAVERMSVSLAKRLEEQKVPPYLWAGSVGATQEKQNCPFCNDTGIAYGDICVCVRESRPRA